MEFEALDRKAKKANKKAEKEYRNLLLKYNNIFSSVDGRDVLRDIFTFCGIYSDGFVPDPTTTAYNSGRRSAGLYILDKILQIDENVYLQLIKEGIYGDASRSGDDTADSGDSDANGDSSDGDSGD